MTEGPDIIKSTQNENDDWISYPKLFVSEQTGHGDGEEESDIFAIREVSFQPEGDGDWKETSYTLNTDSLDWVRALLKDTTTLVFVFDQSHFSFI